MKYNVNIQPGNISYCSDSNLLDDAISENIVLEHSCKTGDCGMCRAEVLSGQVQNEHGQIVEQGSILACQSKAMSDLVLKANYYPQLAGIKIQTVPCKVSRIHRVTDDILVLNYRFPPTAAFEYLSGQYVDLSFNGVKRSYSIANACKTSKEIELHIRKVPHGQMSKLLFSSVAENQLMRLEGPKGTFFVRDGNNPLIFLATGTGIAPVKAMVESLIQSNDSRPIHIYWGMQYQTEIYCDELINYSNQYQHIHFTSVLSREHNSQSKHGYVQNAVLDDFNSLSDTEVYACGSTKMIEQAKALFIESGLSSENFHSDAFTPAKQN
ncbi:FAD-binding oxidoreductase [Vibrio diazotrophicus]|uniref:FAD-binding oxidoreductase n=1 Tax=Vibrio diazotrophicus TaxID=685 RepID=UPI000C9E42D7|nr:FAD-binding oxidoreductase [Vibrio diazotrophicus]PNH80590.1 CDP-6-deoxy-delta-3,4-glucoseen reductase [Vibrio diazotrophicus]